MKQSERRICFHINRSSDYLPYPQLTLGQTITAGNALNPFFKYYDTNVRTFPVTFEDGSVVNQTPRMFLNNVVNGSVRPKNLAVDAQNIAEDYFILARELLFENVRLSEFPERPSRSKAIWLSQSLNEVWMWHDTLSHGQPGFMQCVEAVCTGEFHRCDASWLPGDSMGISSMINNARQYWSGEINATKTPKTELLFVGKLVVQRVMWSRYPKSGSF